jgi:hypothetical protein
MHADGPCGRPLDLEACGGAGMRLAARAADRKANRGRADGRYRMLSTDSGSRPRPGIRTSPKSPLSTGVFCEFRCHEAAVRDLTTPAMSRRWWDREADIQRSR